MKPREFCTWLAGFTHEKTELVGDDFRLVMQELDYLFDYHIAVAAGGGGRARWRDKHDDISRDVKERTDRLEEILIKEHRRLNERYIGATKEQVAAILAEE